MKTYFLCLFSTKRHFKNFHTFFISSLFIRRQHESDVKKQQHIFLISFDIIIYKSCLYECFWMHYVAFLNELNISQGFLSNLNPACSFYTFPEEKKKKQKQNKWPKKKKFKKLKIKKKGRLMVKSEQQIWGLQYVKCCCLKPLKSSYQTHTEDKATLYDVPTTACHGIKIAIIYRCHWSLVCFFSVFSGLPKAFLSVYFQFIVLLNVSLSVNHLIFKR